MRKEERLGLRLALAITLTMSVFSGGIGPVLLTLFLIALYVAWEMYLSNGE